MLWNSVDSEYFIDLFDLFSRKKILVAVAWILGLVWELDKLVVHEHND